MRKEPRARALTRRDVLAAAAGAVGVAALAGCGQSESEKKPEDKQEAAMPKLTIVANIHAEPEHTKLIRAELEKLISITRKEKGCLLYDLHQDNEDAAHFMFFETWESRALWQEHMKAPHLAAYMAATEGKVAKFTLNEMTKIA